MILVTGIGWKGTPPGGIQFDRSRSEKVLPWASWLRYGQSQLANLLYARDTKRYLGRYPDILSCSIHPGVVKTSLVTGLTFSQKLVVYLPNTGSMLTPEQGTYNLLWAITKKRGTVKSGTSTNQSESCRPRRPRRVEDAALQKTLWGLDRDRNCQTPVANIFTLIWRSVTCRQLAQCLVTLTTKLDA